MIKTLFFYVDTQTSSGYTTGMGVASISSYLKKHGVFTDIVYYKSEDDFEYSIRKTKEFLPDIVGFYSPSCSWGRVKRLSEEIRLRFPAAFQVYGGIHAILVPETLYQVDSLDALCVGYGEVPMLDLAERIESGKEISSIRGMWVKKQRYGRIEVIKSPPYFPEGDHDEFLGFDHEAFLKELSRFKDFEIDSYRLEIIFTRGCPFSCSFCCNAKLSEIYGNKMFIPSPEASIRVLRDSLKATSAKFIEIHDDNLTLNKRWFREFIGMYADTVKIPFMCNMRAGTFDEDDIRLLSKTMVHSVWVGIESGNDHIRNDILKKTISREQIVKSLDLLRKYHIDAIVQNLIGVPYERPEDFIDTIKLNAEARPAGYQLSTLNPYPKTELYEVCAREGWLAENTDAIVQRVDPEINTPDFPKEIVRFYFLNFKRLVKYQQLRILLPYIFFLPLTHKTSRIIAAIFSIQEVIISAIRRAVKSILPEKARIFMKKRLLRSSLSFLA
ncbi:MAG: radical SAM protein [Candidatus Omnitrophota bacterium]